MLKIFIFDRHYSRILHSLTKIRGNRTIRCGVIAKNDVLQYGVGPPSWIWKFQFCSNHFHHSHCLIQCTKFLS